MYRVYCDGLMLYHSMLENLRLLDPELNLELNQPGKFTFAIYPDHPYYSLVHKLKSILTVYQDDYLLFRGRALDEKVGWHTEKKITCEGDLAFLLDSIIRPFSFAGTPAEFVAYVLSLHNAQVDDNKRFLPGNVTVEGFVNYETEEYLTAKETLQKGVFEPIGGYLLTRYEDGQAYLDYLSDITLLAPQPIDFGRNLLDLTRDRKGADVATVIIPLGAKLKDEDGKETGQRLTIESVNGGVDFVQDENGVAQYGVIVKSVIFDDVTDAETLKQRGQAHLSDSVNWPETVELSAADLPEFASFHLGTQVRMTSKPHGISQLFRVTKLGIRLDAPATNKLTLGATIEGFSEAVTGLAGQQQQILQVVEQTAKTAAETVYNVEQNLLASMQVESDNIKATVAENYYLKDETDSLVSSVSTTIEQTKDSFEIQFNQFSQDIAAVAAGTDADFEEIRKYIRFVDGMILLGEVGNELELQISNDRISFLQDGAEVAYFSNRKLYITDAQVMHSLQIGGFAFMPRANGNTSFKKI